MSVHFLFVPLEFVYILMHLITKLLQTIIESYHEDLEAMSAELTRVLQGVQNKEQAIAASDSTITDLRSKMSSLEGQLRARGLEALSQMNEARAALQRKDAELAEALTLASDLNKERGKLMCYSFSANDNFCDRSGDVCFPGVFPSGTVTVASCHLY